jgi:membrane protease YdiL (CAAX protease family)
MEEPTPRSTNFATSAVLFESLLAVVAVLVGMAVGFSPLEKLPLTLDALPQLGRAALWGAAAALPLFVGLALLENLPIAAIRRIQAVVDGFLSQLLRSTSVFDLAVLSLMAGVGEEVLFRGLIQAGLAQWIGPPYGVWIAIAVASIAFGLAHAVTPTYAVLATLIGVYLGWLFLATDSLAAPIVAHAVYDFGALVYFSRRTRHT